MAEPITGHIEADPKRMTPIGQVAAAEARARQKAKAAADTARLRALFGPARPKTERDDRG